jgi:hypothetical protein
MRTIAQFEGVEDPGGSMHATEERADAGQKFLRAERFDEVIVGADIEAADPILHLSFGGEHENGNGIGQAPQFAAEGVAIELGHHQVEQDEVGLLFDGPPEAAFAVFGGDDAKTFLLQDICSAVRMGNSSSMISTREFMNC